MIRPLLVAASLAAATPAFADRMPTADELARIETALKAAGFTRWESIELEDDGAPMW